MTKTRAKHLIWLLFLPLTLTGPRPGTPKNGKNERITRYGGICDASAGQALGDSRFVMANDEDNFLRFYPLDEAAIQPLESLAAGRWFKLDRRKKNEMDLEGSARVADTIYWIGSHGRSASGKLRDNRHVFFATRVHAGGKLSLPGRKAYPWLLEDLLASPWLGKNPMGLKKATQIHLEHYPPLAPKREGINIESLAPGPAGSLLIGLRNPRYQTRAIVIPFLNPAEVLRDFRRHGRRSPTRARFGKPILLPLESRGLRAMALRRDNGIPPGTDQEFKYYLVAGPPDNGTHFSLYEWRLTWQKTRNGWQQAKENLRKWRDLPVDFIPEGLFISGPAGRQNLRILSDDGRNPVPMAGKTPCKLLSQEGEFKRSGPATYFRLMSLPLP